MNMFKKCKQFKFGLKSCFKYTYCLYWILCPVSGNIVQHVFSYFVWIGNKTSKIIRASDLSTHHRIYNMSHVNVLLTHLIIFYHKQMIIHKMKVIRIFWNSFTISLISTSIKLRDKLQWDPSTFVKCFNLSWVSWISLTLYDILL